MAKKKNKQPKKKEKRLNEHGKMDTRPIIWTREKILGELVAMLVEIQSNLGIVFVGQLFEQRNYSRLYVARWVKQYKEDDEICNAIERIEHILESRAAVGAMKGDYNPHFTKFHLINNHDWKDKSEVEQRHKGLPSLSKLLAATAKRERGEEEKED